MNLVDRYQNAIPAVLLDPIGQVVSKTGAIPTSVYRGPDAASILNRHGKHTQQQIWDASPAQRAAWGVVGTPNPPGRSTHECRSDGVAYAGPPGRHLADWQCGMDWPDSSIASVMAAFRQIGEIPIHPYPAGVEYHHINLARAPVVLYPFLPLHVGQKGKTHTSVGPFVLLLTHRLGICGYLPHRTLKFDYAVEKAVKEFQRRHHLVVDGIVGVHTWLNLKAAAAACKKKHRKEFP
jgi:peptidoglycan hydrolase-like protein with peptidoglycan-binding domain